MIEGANLLKPIPSKDQTIEIIDDNKNEVFLHKRKVQEPVSRSFKNESILNLPISTNENEVKIVVSTPVKPSTLIHEREYSRNNIKFQ